MNPFVTLLVILLIPGIISAVIFEKITQHEKWTWYYFATYTVLFGWFSYAPLYLIYYCTGINFKIVKTPLKALGTLDTSVYLEVLLACIPALILAFLAAYCANKKYLNRLAQRTGCSNKYGDENLFSYSLNNAEIDWVYVRCAAKGLIYRGLIRRYSDENALQEMLLADADVYNYADSAHLYSVDGLYLCGKAGDFTIELASDKTGLNDNKLVKIQTAYRKARTRTFGRKRYKTGLLVRPKEFIAPPPAQAPVSAAAE